MQRRSRRSWQTIQTIQAIEYFKKAILQPIDIVANLCLPSINTYSTMALADAQYITYDEYIDKRNEQDHLLRVEFGKIHNCIDTFGTEIAVLKDDVAVLKDDVAVLKDDVAVLKDNVAVLKDDVAVRFDKVGRDFDELRVSFLQMEGRMHNGSIHNPFLQITPIPIY